MIFNIENPLILLLLPFISAMIIIPTFRKNILVKKRGVIILRIIIFALLVLALSDFSIYKAKNRTETLVLKDISDSMKNSRTYQDEFIKKLINSRPKDEFIAVMSFNNDIRLEKDFDSNDYNSGLRLFSRNDGTDIEKAIRSGMTLFSNEAKKRILIITDGYENKGDIYNTISAIKDNEIELLILKPDEIKVSEAYIKSIKTPDEIKKGDKYNVEVSIISNTDMNCMLNIFYDEVSVINKDVELKSGDNNFNFTAEATKTGTFFFKAEIYPEKDTFTENNSFIEVVHIKSIPKVLMISKTGESEFLIKNVLKNTELEIRRPESAPESIEGLKKYDAFIINNIEYESFKNGFLSSIEYLIRENGKGLLLTSGEKSMAPGGYKDTVLEEILPVNMQVKSKSQKSDLAMLLVIDKSGSMMGSQFGIQKMSQAKEAAIGVVENMNDDDYIGIITFDYNYKWVVETTKLTDRNKIINSIGTIQAGGGTSIVPGLMEAANNVSNINTAIKHIILLTDGQAEKYGYEDIFSILEENKISLSTVAVGGGADRSLLFYLAEQGKGRYYQTDAFSDIPNIFLKETMLARKTYINNITFELKRNSNSTLLTGVNYLTKLDGYIAVTGKGRSDISLTGPEETPLLASWQYGLGKTVAWMSDIDGKWTSDAINTSSFQKLFENIKSYIIPPVNNKKVKIGHLKTRESNMVSVKIDDYKPNTGENLILEIKNKDTAKKYNLTPNNENEFSAITGDIEPGLYTGRVILENDNVEKIVGTEMMAINYSDEYVDINPEASIIKNLLYKTNGTQVNTVNEVFSIVPESVKQEKDISRLLILLALFLFLLDITMRRMNITFDNIVTFFKEFIYRKSNWIKNNRTKKTSKNKSGREYKEA
jgi:Mg-chelatase subunit ChlD